MPNNRPEYDAMLQTVASGVLAKIKGHVKKTKWVSAYLEVRAAANNLNDRMEKVRITKKDGTIDGTCDIDFEIMDQYLVLWKLMPKVFDSVWYGFKLTVYTDSKHEIEYNYDPNCIDDPNFIDW